MNTLEEQLKLLYEEYYKAWEVQDWHWCEMISKCIDEIKGEMENERSI